MISARGGVLESDRELARQHVTLAAAILDGQPIRAGRIGRQIAERELRSLTDRLG